MSDITLNKCNDCELALDSERTVTTTVVSEPSISVKEGVIHLKLELEQNHSSL